MPTNRARRPHGHVPEFSSTALFYATDEFWGSNDDISDRFIYAYPTVEQCRPQCRELWLAVHDEFLPEYIHDRPGSRPNWWWEFDAPRMAEADLQARGWLGAYFAPRVYQPRRRVGGTGLADFERYSRVVPVFRYGIPASWDSIDPDDPPRFESQPTYLARHGLLSPEENRQLKPEDFEPEAVMPPT